MSMYPVLGNRPIDQWKVTELKEELRRRKIVPKGLKEDLVRRLFEEIQRENETNNTVKLNNGFDADPDPLGVGDEEKKEQRYNTEDAVVKNENAVEDITTGATADISPDADTVTKAEDGDITFNASLDLAVNETPTDGVATANSEINKSDVAFDADRIVKAEDGDNICDDSLGGIVNETPAAGASEEIERSDLATQFESYSKESIYNEKHEDLKPSDEDANLDLVEPNNQVSEVSTDLGFQVKCESISTDSVSINETIKLKDNSNADNFHLEVEVVKPEMVQPSAGDVNVVGDLHPLDGDKGSVKDQTSLEEIDGKYANSMELSQINDSADGGSPEKLNLDRSSGDESMEDDVLESKNVEFKTDSDKLGGRAEDNKVNTAEEETQVDIMSVGFSPDKKDIVAEEKMRLMAPIIKRKPEENAVVGINEGFKRQRRWNSETLKVPDRQASNIGSSNTPKDVFQPTPKPALARSGSTVSRDTPKERIVPPSQNPATNSLRIDHFVRPLTLKAVQELLAKTGTVCSFWMDHIKTHCFVTYSSVDEAIETRNAVYNLQWPPNGGRHLVADFVDPQEVKIRAEASSQLSAPISPNPTTPTAPPFKQTQAPQPIRQNVFRQQLPPPPPLPLPPPLSQIPVEREQLPPPPPLKKPEPPALTLDDLFKKTKTTPRIYYLPLSDEQVAAKLAAQGKAAEE